MKKTSSSQDMKARAARRKEQNRIAQAKRRNNREQLIKQLEEKVSHLNQALSNNVYLVKELYRLVHQLLSVKVLCAQEYSLNQSNISKNKYNERVFPPILSPGSSFTSSSILSESLESDINPLIFQQTPSCSIGLGNEEGSSYESTIEQVMENLLFDPLETRLSKEEAEQSNNNFMFSGYPTSSSTSTSSASEEVPVHTKKSSYHSITNAASKNSVMPSESWTSGEITMKQIEDLREMVQSCCDDKSSNYKSNRSRQIHSKYPLSASTSLPLNSATQRLINKSNSLMFADINMQDWKLNLPHSL